MTSGSTPASCSLVENVLRRSCSPQGAILTPDFASCGVQLFLAFAKTRETFPRLPNTQPSASIKAFWHSRRNQ